MREDERKYKDKDKEKDKDKNMQDRLAIYLIGKSVPKKNSLSCKSKWTARCGGEGLGYS